MRRGNTIIAIVVGVLALIFFTFAIVYYAVYGILPSMAKSAGEALFGGSASAQNTSSVALETVDCAKVAKVPTIYLPYIKQFAKVYLKGDEAVIIAVIKHESNFRANAISNTGAVGIGQFVAPTAQGLQDSAGLFKGLTITVVPRADKSDERKVTPAEKVAFLQNELTRDSGRLHPEPSIEALAYKMKNALKAQDGNLREAYAKGYHGWRKNKDGTDNAGDKTAAYAAADEIVKTYKTITDGGGCKALKDTPGKLGEDLRKLTTGTY